MKAHRPTKETNTVFEKHRLVVTTKEGKRAVCAFWLRIETPFWR